MNGNISHLRCLGTQEWEWRCGKYDFHVLFDAETGTWVLEQFLTSEKRVARAHLDEAECESLEDALLFSLEAGTP